MIATDIPYRTIPDLDGRPLDAGYVYFGSRDENPETTPVTVYWDAAGTQPAAQPIRTSNGFMVRNGTPALVYVASDYSMTVRNRKRELVLYAPSSAKFVGQQVDEFTCTDGQTAFTLSSDSGTADDEFVVTLDGLVLSSSDYSVSGTAFTLAQGAFEGQQLVVRYGVALPIGAVDASQVTYTPAGATAVDTNVQAKLRESVSIQDHGTSADWVAALVAAGAATTGTVFVPANVTAINPSAGQVAGVLALLSRLQVDGDLTINLPSGTHVLTSPAVVRVDGAERLKIKGPASVTVSITSQVSVSGSAGAYSVVLGLSTIVGVSVGDWLLTYSATGTGRSEIHRGVWKITNVDSVNGRVTVLNTAMCAAFPTNTITSSGSRVLKCTLQFNDCDGFVVPACALGEVSNFVVAGNSDSYWSSANVSGTEKGTHGFLIGSQSVALNGKPDNANQIGVSGGHVSSGQFIGVSGFDQQGVVTENGGTFWGDYVASCNNKRRGFYASTGSAIRSKNISACGNFLDGCIADIGGDIYASSASCASGNGSTGVAATQGGAIIFDSGIASCNLSHGGRAVLGATLQATTATFASNGGSGAQGEYGGIMVLDNATCTANTQHGIDANAQCAVRASGASCTSNTLFGIRSTEKAVVVHTGATFSGNGSGDLGTRGDGMLLDGTTYRGAIVLGTEMRAISNSTLKGVRLATTSGGDDAVIGHDTAGAGTYTNKWHFRSGTTGFYSESDGDTPAGRATNRFSNVYGVNFRAGDGTATWTSGTGTPEGAVTAVVGSMFTRTDGGASTTLYVKESGSGNTGWRAV